MCCDVNIRQQLLQHMMCVWEMKACAAFPMRGMRSLHRFVGIGFVAFAANVEVAHPAAKRHPVERDVHIAHIAEKVFPSEVCTLENSQGVTTGTLDLNVSFTFLLRLGLGLFGRVANLAEKSSRVVERASLAAPTLFHPPSEPLCLTADPDRINQKI
jgi:hypothetical protein